VADLDVGLGELAVVVRATWKTSATTARRLLSQVPAVEPRIDRDGQGIETPRLPIRRSDDGYALMQAPGMVDDHTADCWIPLVADAPSRRP